MSDRHDPEQPLDHLPPQDERDDGTDLDQPDYPDVGAPVDEPDASPETAAEPDKPRVHGMDKLPPAGR
ncbi:hypothetical protein ABZ477_11330 [Microbacterium sp. NPDC019599]|uniref:hypothetical protein n=1 Tax=Microbacterium sp. NPDC019599 TaxID=3154690 RepID=UPI0033D88486